MNPLKLLRYGGRQIAISSTDRRVALMDGLRAGFQEGYLQAPTVTIWPLERAVEAYEAVEKGHPSATHILIPVTTRQV